MRDRPKRNLSSEDCRCCMIGCSPCLAIWVSIEYILKGICCCPCYIDIYCCDKKKKIVSPNPIAIPEAIAIPIDDDIMTRYNGKIWGVRDIQIQSLS